MKDKNMGRNYQKDNLLILKIPTEVKGYRVQDVDQIIDKILEDYESYEEEIRQLRLEIKETKEENQSLQNNLNHYSKARQEKINRSVEEMKDNLSNADVIKRISNIEQALIQINDKLTNQEK
jgi:cell division septum initiation protein DivIVA